MKLTISSVQLLSFSRDAEGGKAQFSASLTKPLIQQLEWGEVPEFFTGAKLEGEIVCQEIVLTPNDESLKRHACQIKANKIAKFETIRLELEGTKSGKGHRTELRFTVWFNDMKGARMLEEYILTAGKSSLSVSYEKQPVQTDLPGVEVEEDQQETPLQ